jgi:hypothetical protein
VLSSFAEDCLKDGNHSTGPHSCPRACSTSVCQIRVRSQRPVAIKTDYAPVSTWLAFGDVTSRGILRLDLDRICKPEITGGLTTSSHNLGFERKLVSLQVSPIRGSEW